MAEYDYVIIGGGIAGVSAGEAIREYSPEASIAIISSEKHLLYSRVLLPHFVKGVIERERVFLRTAGDYAKRRIDLFLGKEVVRVDVGKKNVQFASGEVLPWKKLLISSGGKARGLGLANEYARGVSRFQTLDDAERMCEWLPRVRRAVVVGGGFIALEYLAILALREIPTTLVMRDTHVFNDHLDEIGGRLLLDNYRHHGIEVISGDTVAAIEGAEVLQRVRTHRGTSIDCDFLGIGVGLERDLTWLKDLGVPMTPAGILTNEFLETGVRGVFAAGDAACFYDRATATHHSRGNWVNAVLQGKIAAWNMVAPLEQKPFSATATYSIQNLGLTITFLGETRLGKGTKAVSRLWPEENAYERFFLRGEILNGAILINRVSESALASGLIQDRVAIANPEKLADPAFLLSDIRGRA